MEEKWEEQEKKSLFKEELDAQMSQVKQRMQVNDALKHNPNEKYILEKSALVSIHWYDVFHFFVAYSMKKKHNKSDK